MTRYAVIGTPIAQSKSPAIHRMFAEQTKQDVQYEAIEVAADNFDSFVLDFFANGGGGLNVTVPHKERAYRIANQLEPLAEQAGAVNTLFQDAEGTLCGDNTDGVGLVRDIQANNGIAIECKNLLVIGAGGAVRGALVSLIEEKPATITLVNRTKEKAVDLKKIFPDLEIVNWGENANFDMIINATSVGLKKDDEFELNYTDLGSNKFFYDVIYNPKETNFLKKAKREGNQIENGKMMFIYQAHQAFTIWHKIMPEIDEETIELLDND